MHRLTCYYYPSRLIRLIASICLIAALLPQNVRAEASLKKVDTASGRPDDAVVIFDGKDTAMLAGPNGGPFNWALEDGSIIVKPGQQERQQGLYLHGLFELQIIDSFNNAMDAMDSTGSLYKFSPPLVDATRDVDVWQSYDVIFIAPRRDESGKPVKPGSITVLLNGVLVQHNTPFSEHLSIYTPLHFRTTPYAERIRESLMKTGCGPMQLQDHDHPVRFRNIWIRPLDDKAFVFEGE